MAREDVDLDACTFRGQPLLDSVVGNPEERPEQDDQAVTETVENIWTQSHVANSLAPRSHCFQNRLDRKHFCEHHTARNMHIKMTIMTPRMAPKRP